MNKNDVYNISFDELEKIHSKAINGDKKSAIKYTHFCVWKKILDLKKLNLSEKKLIYENLIKNINFSVEVING